MTAIFTLLLKKLVFFAIYASMSLMWLRINLMHRKIKEACIKCPIICQKEELA